MQNFELAAGHGKIHITFRNFQKVPFLQNYNSQKGKNYISGIGQHFSQFDTAQDCEESVNMIQC